MSKHGPDSLGVEKISSLLARYAFPAIVAMASSSIYNIIDSVFLGRGVGAIALSALAVAMPLMNISSALGSMVGIGSAALVSIRMGEGHRQDAFRILGNVVLLSLTLGAGMSAVALLFLDDVLVLFGASDATLPYARDFMRIILAGNVVTHLYLSLNEVLRASGYPMRSMAVMLTAVALNCVLNPLFIFGLGWGVAGSACATVIAQCSALCIEIRHYSSPDSYLHFKRGIFRFDRRIIGGILAIGLAPFLLHLCSSAVVIFINKALLRYGGDIYVGAYGVINRVALLFIMIVSGLNQGMQPIVGYNYGAGRYERVRKAFALTALTAVCVMSVALLVSQVFPRQVAGLFVSGDDEHAARLVDIASHGMRIVMVIFPIVGFQIVSSNFFQYIDKAPKAIFLSLTRQMIFLIPLLVILPRYYGTSGVWYSMPIADGIASLFAAVLIVRQMRSLRKKERQ